MPLRLATYLSRRDLVVDPIHMPFVASLAFTGARGDDPMAPSARCRLSAIARKSSSPTYAGFDVGLSVDLGRSRRGAVVTSGQRQIIFLSTHLLVAGHADDVGPGGKGAAGGVASGGGESMRRFVSVTQIMYDSLPHLCTRPWILLCRCFPCAREIFGLQPAS